MEKITTEQMIEWLEIEVDCGKRKMLSDILAHIKQTTWQPIETAPKDIEIDTFGEFRPIHSDEVFFIRFPEDWIGSNTPYPIVRTGFEHDGMYGPLS